MNYGAPYQYQAAYQTHNAYQDTQTYNPYQDPNQKAFSRQQTNYPNKTYQEEQNIYQDDPGQEKKGRYLPWVVGGVGVTASLLAAYNAYLSYLKYQGYNGEYNASPPFSDIPDVIFFRPGSSASTYDPYPY